MKKHVLILGAGFGGLELAARLSDSLADEVQVTLIDQNDSFIFGFSKLDIMFGRRATAATRLHYRDISKEGVEFRQRRVTSPAPFEAALLIHDHLIERGVRGAVDIRVLGPMEAPVPVTKEVSRGILRALGDREIEYLPRNLVVGLDNRHREAWLESGGSVSYDLFIGIPIHRVPEVVKRSGLADGGWIPVDQANLMTRFPNVYALGDVAGAPVAKAGVLAEAAARAVAEDIAARLRGAELERPYDGAGNCYIEFGNGMVGKVEANFLGGPKPTARLVGPSRELAAEKAAFASTRRERWFS